MSAADIDSVLRDLGRRVRAARDRAELTQEQVAELANIDTKRLQRIEAGTVNVTVKTLVRIGNAIGISIWQLAGAQAGRQRRVGPRREQR